MSPTQKELADRLSRVPLFSGLNERRRRKVARLMRTYRFPSDDVVVVRSDDNRPVRYGRMFVILNGTAEVRRDGTTIAWLGPADHFGEMALLDGGPRSADVYATADLDVAALSDWDFNALLLAEPEIAVAVIRSLVGRLRVADEAAVEGHRPMIESY